MCNGSGYGRGMGGGMGVSQGQPDAFNTAYGQRPMSNPFGDFGSQPGNYNAQPGVSGSDMAYPGGPPPSTGGAEPNPLLARPTPGAGFNPGYPPGGIRPGMGYPDNQFNAPPELPPIRVDPVPGSVYPDQKGGGFMTNNMGVSGVAPQYPGMNFGFRGFNRY